MTQPTRLVVPANVRVFVVGANGTGKSFWTNHAYHDTKRLIVCDGKGMIKNDEWRLQKWSNTAFRRLRNERHEGRYRIGPRKVAEWEQLFERLLELRNVTIIIDELSAVGTTGQSEGLRGLLQRGRELGIAMCCSTQRPTFIPLNTMSEASIFVQFRLRMQTDKERMREVIPDLQFENYQAYVWDIDPIGHEFIYYDDIQGKAWFYDHLNVVHK